MNKILVIGGKSYIGRHLREFLPNAIYTDRSHFDLNNLKDIEDFLENIEIELCIILSANICYTKEIDFDKEPFKTNLVGLNNLLITLSHKEKNKVNIIQLNDFYKLG